jgi:sporulation protein YlmC with PRC-barrel domain
MQTKPFVVVGALLAMSTAAWAQTVQPDPNLPVPNPAPVTEPAAPAATALPVDQPKMATGQFIEQQQATQTLASDLIGRNVLDSAGQQIAKISDLIFDDQSKIVGVVLATGGFLGIGEHSVGVELNQLTPNPEATGYVVALSRESIEGAPAFKTLAAAAAERDAEMLRQQSAQPPAAPAPVAPAQ